MVLPVTSPAGTSTQAARGIVSFSTKSANEVEPVAPSSSNALTAPGSTSKTTHVCPSRMRRRTMFAPIRPTPTIPSCIELLVATILAPLGVIALAFDGFITPYPGTGPPEPGRRG